MGDWKGLGDHIHLCRKPKGEADRKGLRLNDGDLVVGLILELFILVNFFAGHADKVKPTFSPQLTRT